MIEHNDEKCVEPNWPKCHFKTMTFHESDSDMSGNSNGFQCDYCGHVITLAEWTAQEKEQWATKRKIWKN